jgi:cell wall-associated NlpC family hydrolase
VKNIVDSGFIEIEKKDLQKHDLIIFKGFSEDQFYHLGMYDGEGNFFHHCVDSLSKVDIFDERHQRLVYKTYRYKGHD